jgi:putative copper resistance protein D
MLPEPHPLEAWLIAARALHVAACMVLFGELLFAAVMHRAAVRWRVVLASVAVALAAGLAWLVLVATAISGDASLSELSATALRATLLETQFGRLWLLRSVLLLAAGVLAAAALRRTTAHASMTRTGALAVAALVLPTLAWASHAAAAAGSARATQTAVDAVHLLAVGAWVGTIAPLLAALGRSAGGARGPLAHRWSRMAMAAVAIVLGSGVANAAFRLGSVDALLASGYGRILVAKLVLVAVMLTIAGVNRAILTPRLAAASGIMALWRTGVIEIVLGLVVIALAATLGTIAPPAHERMHMHASARAASDIYFVPRPSGAPIARILGALAPNGEPGGVFPLPRSERST